MKAYQILSVAMAMVVLTAMGQAQTTGKESVERAYFADLTTMAGAKLVQAEKGYTACLQSENDGVVESSLAHIAVMKLSWPAKEFSNAERQVDVVAGQNPSQEIRYKAYLVSTLMKNPVLFANDAEKKFASPDEVFAALASRMQQMIAGRIQ